MRVPRVTALTVDPTDHNHVWAGIEVDGVLHSTDGGDSWRRITKGINDPDIHDIGVVVNGGATVLTTTPREIFASHDKGESWTGLRVGDQFPLPYCRSLAQKADDPDTLFVATGDGAVGTTGAIQRSTDGGKNWRMAELPVKPNSPIYSWIPQSGETFAVMSTTPARAWPQFRTYDERTNVQLVIWP